MTTKSVFSADFNQQDVIAYLDNAFGKAMTPPPMVIDDAANFRKDADAANIDKALHIGDYPNRIKVYDITLKPNCHIARARVGIKHLVTQLMDNYSYAILLFHYEDTANTEWRISWVTKGGSSNKTNAAKRYTFLCGRMHPLRTIVDRLSQISTSKGSSLPEKITEAFSVETLSDAFFDEYKAFYEDIVQYICGSRYVKEGNKYVRKEIESKTTIEQRSIFEKFASQAVKENPELSKPITETDPKKREEAEKEQEKKKIKEAEKLVRDYVKKLLGRLVFIQFIAKKGWMGLKPTDAWGAGNEHFLLNLYKNASQQDKNDFVQNILKSILFDSLNNNPNGQTDQFGVKVNVKTINAIDYKFPYLNGGLFEETELDKLDINIPGYFFVSNEKDSNGRSYGDDDKNAPKNTPRKFVEVAKKKSKKKNSEEIEDTPYPYDQSEGLFEFFERYNFTIDENDSDEAVVGIDPEMLGKIFENLLEDNKDKGAFYTPKPVVEYMCQQSLIAYLQNGVLKAKSESSDKSSVNSQKVDIAALSAISDDEIKAQIEQFVKTKSLQFTNSVESRQGLGEVGIKSGEETEGKCMSIELVSLLNKLLKDVKICDPAIGSGAFPMGLLNELLACREALQSCGGVQKISRAELKKEIIQNNIYGVDIEEGAIEIARLRFWLSIVIDLDRPEPLPNFDFKFMQGNSLLESVMLPGTKKPFNLNIQEMQKGQFAFPHLKSALNKLHSKLDAFYGETDHNKKASMRGDIKKQVVEVLNAYVDYEPLKMQDIADIAAKTKVDFTCTDFFLWHTWFADVFDKGGFDIVIGNPPYIKQQLFSDTKPMLREPYSNVYDGQADMFVYFFSLGIKSLRPEGVICFITSNKWLVAAYGEKLRDVFLKKTLIYLIDCGQVFETADVDALITLWANRNPQPQQMFGYLLANDLKDFKSITYQYKQQGILSNTPWNFNNNITDTIIAGIQAQPIKWSDITKNIAKGSSTGNDTLFLFDIVRKEGNMLRVKNEYGEFLFESDLLHPFAYGEDVERLAYTRSTKYILYPYNVATGKLIQKYDIETNYPNIYEYLCRNQQTLLNRKLEMNDNDFYKYSACRNAKVYPCKKILIPDLLTYGRFGYDNVGLWHNAGIHSLKINPKYQYLDKGVLGILNSQLFWYFISRTSANFNNTSFRLMPQYIKPFAFPNIGTNNVLYLDIASIVDNILSTKNNTPTAYTTPYERQIDALVYELYGITTYPELLEIEGDKAKALQMLVLMTIHQQPNSTEAELIQQLTPTTDNAPFSAADIQEALAALKNEGMVSLNGNQLKFK